MMQLPRIKVLLYARTSNIYYKHKYLNILLRRIKLHNFVRTPYIVIPLKYLILIPIYNFFTLYKII